MKSIYEQVLGDDFRRLHPKLQEKFGLTSEMNRLAVSSGVMEEMTGGHPLLRPMFMLGARKHILFPERGKEIPFVLKNYAYRDEEGKECYAWERTFSFPENERRFDATMVYDEQKHCIVDYFGTERDFVSELDFEVLDGGGLRIISRKQYVILFGIRLPLPPLLQGHAVIDERYEESRDCIRIHVNVRNPLAGTLIHYRGSFRTEFVLKEGN